MPEPLVLHAVLHPAELSGAHHHGLGLHGHGHQLLVLPERPTPAGHVHHLDVGSLLACYVQNHHGGPAEPVELVPDVGGLAAMAAGHEPDAEEAGHQLDLVLEHDLAALPWTAASPRVLQWLASHSLQPVGC